MKPTFKDYAKGVGVVMTVILGITSIIAFLCLLTYSATWINEQGWTDSFLIGLFSVCLLGLILSYVYDIAKKSAIDRFESERVPTNLGYLSFSELINRSTEINKIDIGNLVEVLSNEELNVFVEHYISTSFPADGVNMREFGAGDFYEFQMFIAETPEEFRKAINKVEV